MSVNDSSFWPTATVCGNHNRTGASATSADGLSTAVKKWSTPDGSVFNDQQSIEAYEARKVKEIAKGYNGNGGGTPLAMEVKLWSTPRASEGSGVRKSEAAREIAHNAGDMPLNVQAKSWATPRATDAEKGGPNNKGSKGDPALPAQIHQWATPTARDWNSGGDPSASVATNSLLGRQAPRTTKDGLLSLLPDGWTFSPLFLNPRFVEWLMGWPENWLCPELHELTNCEGGGMASWLYRQRALLSGWLERQEWREAA